jgi:Rrf2 family protein
VFQDHTLQVALQAALYLAQQPPGRLAPVREIAGSTGLPGPFLSKVMGRLARAGLVRSHRGPGGGLALRRGPRAITVLAVMRAVEGRQRAESCALSGAACSEKSPCALHAHWAAICKQMQRVLKETTLAALADDGRRASARLRRATNAHPRRAGHASKKLPIERRGRKGQMGAIP